MGLEGTWRYLLPFIFLFPPPIYLYKTESGTHMRDTDVTSSFLLIILTALAHCLKVQWKL